MSKRSAAKVLYTCLVGFLFCLGVGSMFAAILKTF